MIQRTASSPEANLFDASDDDVFEGIPAGDGVYPEPTEDDCRMAMAIIHGRAPDNDVG